MLGILVYSSATSKCTVLPVGRRSGGTGGVELGRRNDLSPRQRETLEWMRDFIRRNRIPPTVREIGAAFGTKSSSVFDLLKALEEKGYIRREAHKARSIVLLGSRFDQGTSSAGPGRGQRQA